MKSKVLEKEKKEKYCLHFFFIWMNHTRFLRPPTCREGGRGWTRAPFVLLKKQGIFAVVDEKIYFSTFSLSDIDKRGGVLYNYIINITRAARVLIHLHPPFPFIGGIRWQ